MKAHATVDSVQSGLIAADDLAGRGPANAARKVVVLTHRSAPGSGVQAATLAVTCWPIGLRRLASGTRARKVSLDVYHAGRCHVCWRSHWPGREAEGIS